MPKMSMDSRVQSSDTRSPSTGGPPCPNRDFLIPPAVLQKLGNLKHVRRPGTVPPRGEIPGSVHVLPLHRLSLLPNLRVLDAQCLNFIRSRVMPSNSKIPVVPASLSMVPASPPLSPSELLRKLAENRLPAVPPADPFPPAQPLGSSDVRPTQWRSYSALFPSPIESCAERFKACLVHFILNAWFLYVPPVLYTLYRRHCTTKRRRLLFIACLLFMLLWPTRRYLPSRRWRIWRLLHRYHRATVIVEDAKSLPPTQPTLFTALPHAIVPVAQAVLPTGEFGTLLGHFRIAVASVLKFVPVYGHMTRLVGSRDATGASCSAAPSAQLKKTLETDRESIVLSPGGIGEMYAVDGREEKLLLKDRQGMLRLALQTGADVVPIYCFGNSQTFKLVKGSTALQPLAR
ncbi:diacylglycerol acyltransferase [Cystoisospora suis]|uniref:Acyltransferase n=1 Tax=Cystoisospora suis TaxID=483139 RepID=A0A2C6KHW3_9APIC|nr:diacylglycerol acyltransferase [Cystoisospora suis]